MDCRIVTLAGSMRVDKAHAGLDRKRTTPPYGGVVSEYCALPGDITRCHPGGVETLGTSLGLKFDFLPFLQAFEA